MYYTLTLGCCIGLANKGANSNTFWTYQWPIAIATKVKLLHLVLVASSDMVVPVAYAESDRYFVANVSGDSTRERQIKENNSMYWSGCLLSFFLCYCCNWSPRLKIGKRSDIPDDDDESGFTDASLGDNVEDDNEEASTRYSKR